MKMFLQIFLIVIALVILIYLSFSFVKILTQVGPAPALPGTVCIGNQPAGRCFQIEVARTESQRERGLMYRKELDKDKGMLFIFDRDGMYPFWMKNTLIPLDMVWISAPLVGGNRVVSIAENVQPCKSLLCPSVIPGATAKYVLEVNAGVCKEIGLKLGDLIEINTK